MYSLPKKDYRLTAKNMLDRNGVVCTYSRIVKGSYDVDTSTTTADSIQTYSIKAFPVQASYSEQNNPNLVNSQLKVLIVSYLDLPIKPLVNDKVLLDSITYTVAMVKEHNSYQGVAAWRLVVKEG